MDSKALEGVFTNEVTGDPVVACAVCGFGHTHIVDVFVQQGHIDASITHEAVRSIGKELPSSRVRGSVVRIRFECEQGHFFDHRYQFHKGSVEFSAEKCSGKGAVDELWRD